MIYNLAQIIEQAALRFPKKEAFRCLDDAIGYDELDKKSNQLASYLLNSGLQKGDRVAIYMNRCLDSAVAIYGILKAGGAFVAINPFSPLERTLIILNDCNVEHLITTAAQSKKVTEISKEAPFLKSIVGASNELDTPSLSWDTLFSIPLDEFNPQEILEQDLASILYTSGSTGVPKGIMHTHYSLLSLAKLEVDLHKATDEDIIGNFAPLHFDQSLFGYFAAPLAGATTVIFPDSYVKMPASLTALVAKERITLWFSVPLILKQVLLYGKIDEHDFSSLRWVRFGGEVFPIKQLRELMKKWSHAKFINSYGPSELARCTYYILEEPPKTDDPIPLGTVWGNTEYKILNESSQEVKKGQSGELVVRTATLMKGYWNNKELTEKSFYRFEIASGYEHIYYRTGDLVRENERSELMFLGRIDRQIKLRGYRIELDEIESVLLKNQHVEEVAVIVTTKNGNKELDAVIRPKEGSEIKEIDLLAFCKRRLPPYAVPSTISLMDNFPRTGNGKINRPEIVKLIETNQS